ncbi:MAG: AMP-binding protein [Candidatus Omnitrophica bacterium]|nr:AMP-binding protein [Candidatus Omnitrophota bacterium]
MNLVEFLESSTKNTLDNVALIEDANKVTYCKLWENVSKIAQGFLNLRIHEGDRIAIGLPNCIEYVYVFLAALKINAVVVPLKQSATTYELRKIIKKTKPTLFIIDNRYLKKLLSFVPDNRIGNLVISSKRVMMKYLSQRVVTIESLIKNNDGLGRESLTNDNTLASINFTYRGCGEPLGVMLSHSNYRWGIDTYIKRTEMQLVKKMLLVLPFAHIFPLLGCLLVPLSLGATVVIMKRPNPRGALSLIESLQINMFASVPSFYIMLLKVYDSKRYNVTSLYQCISGGSYLSEELYNEVKEKIGWDICQGYGLTECMPIICNPLEKNKPTSLGNPRGDVKVEIKIVGEDGSEKGVNEEGEIVVRGKTVMKGYYKNEEATRSALKNGWLFTGDYGYFDDEGYLYMVGRKKLITKVGGNAVDLNEVKSVMLSFPDVTKAMVYFNKDELWESLVYAKIRVKNPNSFDVQKLRRFLRKRLSSYKVPRIKIVE